MKALGLILLWFGLATLAATLILRRRTDRPVLHGPTGRRAVRLIAIALVATGLGANTARTPVRAAGGAPDVAASPRTIPADLDALAIAHFRHGTAAALGWFDARRFDALRRAGMTPHDVDDLLMNINAGLPPRLATLITMEVMASVTGQDAPPTTIAEIRAALREVEDRHLFDPWIAAYLWRCVGRTPAGSDAAGHRALFARLARHVRIAHALIRADDEVRPLTFEARAWRSKGGPRPAQRMREEAIRADLLRAASRLYPTTDLGPWVTDAVTVLTIDATCGGVTLVRAAVETPVAAGSSVRYGRLDLLTTPAANGRPTVVHHDWLGRIELPAGRTITVWDLARALSPEVRARVEESVAHVLKTNDEAAALRLERALPLTHDAIRRGLASSPDAAGSGTLRALLVLFDL